MLQVKGKYLYYNGQRIFYLADTNWGAFSSIEMPDWKYYLDTRKQEGFNAVQINLLRQWDNGEPLKDRNPFAVINEADGKYEYDYTRINEAYFDNAESMLNEMIKRDMIPSLVLLWGNYVPGTWMRGVSPNNVMPFECIRPYIEYVIKRFKKFHPLWIVSGDVGFDKNDGPDPAKTIEYYRKVLKVARETDQKGIFAFHINGGNSDLPAEFLKGVDLFLYQSGHAVKDQDAAYKIPEKLRKSHYSGPIIDAELCYEQMIKIGAEHYERYHALDVRRAAWRAVLSGADAGLGYGAFGIWPWTDDSRPESKAKNIFTCELTPFDWRQCLQFYGAKELGYLKHLINELAPNGLKTTNYQDKNFFAAKSENYILIYLPINNLFDFNNLDLQVKQCQVINLTKGIWEQGIIKDNVLQAGSSNEDELIVIDQ